MRRHRFYLDHEPEFGSVTGFAPGDRVIEWVQAPSWHLIVFVRHEGVLTVGGATIPFPAGSAIVIAPSSRCRIERTLECENISHFWINFRPRHQGACEISVPWVSDLSEQAEFWDSLFRRSLDLMHLTKRHLHALTWSLLWALGENAATVRRDAVLAAAERYIEANLGHPLSIAEIAEAVQVSHNNLIKLFHDEHGITPSEFVRSMRVSKACHLLLATDLPIKEIAHQVGFTNAQHFNKVMRMSVGCGPQEVRTNRSGADVFQRRAGAHSIG